MGVGAWSAWMVVFMGVGSTVLALVRLLDRTGLAAFALAVLNFFFDRLYVFFAYTDARPFIEIVLYFTLLSSLPHCHVVHEAQGLLDAGCICN